MSTTPHAVLAAVLLLCACATTPRAPYTAPAATGPSALPAGAAARVLVLVAGDADPRLAPSWLERARQAADSVEAALRDGGFRTTREPLARWGARVTVSAPIRGPDFVVVIEARGKVVDRLELKGRDWGPGELAALGEAARQRVERAEDIAALAGIEPVRPGPAAPAPAPPDAAPATPARRRLAVLEFRGAAPPATLALLADQARAAAADAARASGTAVMTREHLHATLAERGRPTAPCTDGACEVETARAAGADLAVTGEVSDVGGARFLVLKLVDVASGALLASKHARATDDLALLEAAKPAAAALFE